MASKKRNASKKLRPFLSEVVQAIEARTPSATAESWDNVGLLVGDPSSSVTGVVVSIDLTEEAIRVAKEKGYSLIVNHHPCIFPRSKGLGRVVSSGPSALVFEAARSGIAVFSTHTNFDQCALEVPEAVSSALGFSPVGRLFGGEPGMLTKLVVFVPESHLDRVRDAICAAGAGKIGRYDQCAFGVEGEGTFRGSDSTRPFIGRPGELERVREVRLETIFPRGLKKQVLKALREAHPYEEIAYDLYRVEQEPASVGLVSGLGYGVYGDFKTPLSMKTLERKVRETFRTNGFFMTEPRPKSVKRIGFVAGKGSSFLEHAKSVGCDLFITGEAGYHDAREAAAAGLAVMEIGHRESEIFFLRTIERWCSEWKLPVKALNTPIQSCH